MGLPYMPIDPEVYVYIYLRVSYSNQNMGGENSQLLRFCECPQRHQINKRMLNRPTLPSSIPRKQPDACATPAVSDELSPPNPRVSPKTTLSGSGGSADPGRVMSKRARIRMPAGVTMTATGWLSLLKMRIGSSS